MAKLIRSVYVRGLGIHGQFGMYGIIDGSSKFLKIQKLKDLNIEHIASNFFSNAAVTADNKLFYWGWNYNPYSSFQVLDYNQIPILGSLIYYIRTHKKSFNYPHKLFESEAKIKKVVLGNSYLIGLDKNGKVFGVGSNDAVDLWNDFLGATGRRTCSQIYS